MASIELRAAAHQALEACKLIVSAFDALKPASAARNEPLQINAARASITALEAALAEPVQDHFRDARKMVQEPAQKTEMRRCPRCWEPMFPPQRAPLTDEQIDAVWDEWFGAYGLRGSAGSYTRSGFARAIERAHGIGGQP